MNYIPISVWISAIVLFVFSAYSAMQNPALWFHFFSVILLVVSFARVLFYLLEGE